MTSSQRCCASARDSRESTSRDSRHSPPAVSPDERVDDTPDRQPAQQEVPEAMRADRMGDPGRGGIPGQQLAHPRGCCKASPARLEQVPGTLGTLSVDVQREDLPEGSREGDHAVLVALAGGDADAAGVQVDVAQAMATSSAMRTPVYSSVLINTMSLLRRACQTAW
jgi:hypothetical protein